MSNHDKGLDLEDKYFREENAAKLEALKQKLGVEKSGTDAEALKELHHLHCGKCGTKMDTQLFKGVEIEVCPNCGAVLLDPGELQHLVGEDESSGLSFLAQFFGRDSIT